MDSDAADSEILAWQKVEDEMPDGIHAALLTTTMHHTRLERSVIAVWADRPTDRCDYCFEPVSRVASCPLTLDGGSPPNPVQERSQEHSCGLWLSVRWSYIEDPEETSTDEVLAEARQLREQLDADCAAERDEVYRWLRAELRERLADATSDADMTQLLDVPPAGRGTPGIERDGASGLWVADWIDPTEKVDYLSVTENDLS